MVRALSLLPRSFLLCFVLVLQTSLVRGDSPVTPFPVSDIKTIFGFGDSYTTTGYDPAKGVTSTSTTATTSGGPTWIQYLAAANPATASAYYNFAVLGATLSNAVTYSNGAGDFSTQVATFLQYFNSTSSEVAWDADSALFAVWFGPDDLYNNYAAGTNFVADQPYSLTAFDNQIAALYAAGARKFLIADIPSLYRTPVAKVFGSDAIEQSTAYWNSRLAVYMDLFDQQYPGASGYYLHTTNIFNAVLDSPASYGIQNPLTACQAYYYVFNNPTASDPTCYFPLSQFFWRDYWHPTFTVHSIIAQAAISLLAKTSTIIPEGTVPVASGAPASTTVDASTVAGVPTTPILGSAAPSTSPTLDSSLPQDPSAPIASSSDSGTGTDTIGVATLTNGRTGVISIPTSPAVVANATSASSASSSSPTQSVVIELTSVTVYATPSDAQVSAALDSTPGLAVGYSSAAPPRILTSSTTLVLLLGIAIPLFIA